MDLHSSVLTGNELLYLLDALILLPSLVLINADVQPILIYIYIIIFIVLLDGAPTCTLMQMLCTGVPLLASSDHIQGDAASTSGKHYRVC